jgi:hypothetical protein
MVAAALGIIVGALLMRKNYKHFRDHEAEMKSMILDKATSAEQVVMRLRNRIKI